MPRTVRDQVQRMPRVLAVPEPGGEVWRDMGTMPRTVRDQVQRMPRVSCS